MADEANTAAEQLSNLELHDGGLHSQPSDPDVTANTSQMPTIPQVTMIASDTSDSESDFENSEYNSDDDFSYDEPSPLITSNESDNAGHNALIDPKIAPDTGRTLSNVPSDLAVVFIPDCPKYGLNISMGPVGEFSEVRFVDCVFLSPTNFDNCILRNVEFVGCTFSAVKFHNVVIKDVKLYGCELKDSWYSNYTFPERWVLEPQSLCNRRILTDMVPKEIRDREAHAQGEPTDKEDPDTQCTLNAEDRATIPEGFDVAFNNTLIAGVRFVRGDGELYAGALFRNCTFENVSFNNCIFFGVLFENCDFKNVTFTNLVLVNFAFRNCTADHLEWSDMEYESGTEYEGSDFKDKVNTGWGLPLKFNNKLWILGAARVRPALLKDVMEGRATENF